MLMCFSESTWCVFETWLPEWDKFSYSGSETENPRASLNSRIFTCACCSVRGCSSPCMPHLAPESCLSFSWPCEVILFPSLPPLNLCTSCIPPPPDKHTHRHTHTPSLDIHSCIKKMNLFYHKTKISRRSKTVFPDLFRFASNKTRNPFGRVLFATEDFTGADKKKKDSLVRGMTSVQLGPAQSPRLLYKLEANQG